ncbi:MAG: ATP-binding protein, partial [Tannerella sp.]|nr:ATP-binding protein [Tannerella sp.]
DDHLKFVFLTGVSKFAGLSVFSALNSLKDITLDENYASICGYTQMELEDNFPEHIDRAAQYIGMIHDELLAEIRYWYDGYTWDGKTSVYNPYSTLMFFDNKRFTDYWFRTGTPTFLIEIIQRRNRVETVLEPTTVSESVFDGYDPQNIGELPLLFQTGYLTVKHVEVNHGKAKYTLDVPNMEVSDSLLTHLLAAYGKYPNEDIDNLREMMEQHLREGDEQGFANCLEAMIATVPYELQSGCEHYYHIIMLIWMRLLGFKIQGEKPNNRGIADAVWEQPGLTVVAELKYHAEKKIKTLLNEAMKQIHDRRYYNQYIGKVILLGIAFSGKDVGCRMEELKR